MTTNSTASRRSFLKAAIFLCNGLIAGLLAIPGLGFLLTPIFKKQTSDWVEVGLADNFKVSTPQKAAFKYIAQTGYTQKEKKAFVWIRRDNAAESGFVALSAVCTHTGCNVAWNSNENSFVCPCHEGRYDSVGKVISGPPPQPLTKLPVKINGNQLTVLISRTV